MDSKNIQKILRNRLFNNWDKYNFLYSYSIDIIEKRIQSFNQIFDNCLIIGTFDAKIASNLSHIIKNIVFTDISDEMLYHAKSMGYHVCQSDMMHLPFLENTFDIVISVFNLYNAINHEEYFARILMMLKDQGVIVGIDYGADIIEYVKHSLIKIEMQMYDKVCNRYQQTINHGDILGIFHNMKLANTLLINEAVKLQYKSFYQMLLDIRYLCYSRLFNNVFMQKNMAQHIIKNKQQIDININIPTYTIYK